ncbi:MAG: hypothetical protein U0984_09050 [Prosthecobacter sp.]|nr:hypothetical protein [Prosthecobacter sp.]
MTHPRFYIFSLFLLGLSWGTHGAELNVGAATVDITPDQPVALDGQRNARIAMKVKTPIYATVLALESRDGAKAMDTAIMVACDLVAIRDGILQKVRDKVAPRLPGFDLRKLFLSATHTHTAPVTIEGRYSLPETGIMQPSAYAEWMVARIADGIVQAWEARQPGKVGWAQSQAVIAQNRRVTYANGTAAMYGKVNTPDFRALENYEDHNMEVLFFWDMQDKLIATALNVACPSQEVGGESSIHADFWDPVRNQLHAKHGKDLHILPWTGAAGDHTSRLMYGAAADERMRKLRGGLSRLDELARRIVLAWEDAHACARKDVQADPKFEHRVQDIALPWRKVTILERAAAMTEAAQFAKDPKQFWNYRWNQSVVDRFEAQKAGTAGSCQMELHTLRLGDISIATNDFELFTDYAVQMKARSPAIQTFVIQLAGSGGYLPNERAVKGGGYSAVIQSSRVGPEGGQVLVERTLEALNGMWQKP